MLFSERLSLSLIIKLKNPNCKLQTIVKHNGQKSCIPEYKIHNKNSLTKFHVVYFTTCHLNITHIIIVYISLITLHFIYSLQNYLKEWLTTYFYNTKQTQCSFDNNGSDWESLIGASGGLPLPDSKSVVVRLSSLCLNICEKKLGLSSDEEECDECDLSDAGFKL